MEHEWPRWEDGRYGPPERAEALARRAEETRAAVARGEGPSFAEAPTRALCHWHASLFRGTAPLAAYEGGLRGDAAEPCLARNVRVGGQHGVPWERMGETMDAFDARVRALVADVDARVAAGAGDAAEAAVEAAAWVAARVVAIHPFIDGNGRMSRLVAAWLLARWGLDAAVVPLTPSPPPPYRDTGRAAMNGDHLDLR
ncbi:MAG TPA: Fic family protein, partial [Longimicrobium sp.]|nr:Fic family protein [Longimicrobium sp.]